LVLYWLTKSGSIFIGLGCEDASLAATSLASAEKAFGWLSPTETSDKSLVRFYSRFFVPEEAFGVP